MCSSPLFSIAFRVALEGKPTDIDLDGVSRNAGDKWRSLLTHLGVPLGKYRALFEESQGNPIRACFEGLVFWREGNKPCRPPTWSVLLEALKKGAEKREYAEKLEEDIISKYSSGKAAEYSPHEVVSNHPHSHLYTWHKSASCNHNN